jgi:hypothetical protein
MLSLVNDLEAAAGAIAPVFHFGYAMIGRIMDRLNLNAKVEA